MIKRWAPYLFLVIFLLLPSTAEPSSTKIKFDKISIEDGLSQNTARVIFQDRKGFIWIGTQDGLNRYDGYNFKILSNTVDDESGLSDDNINALHEDKFEYLWILTNGGLNRYDPSTETVRKYFHNPEDSHSISSNFIRRIFSDPQGRICFISGNIINMYNRKTDNFSQFSLRNNYGTDNRRVRVRHSEILQDTNHHIWLPSDQGLFHFNMESRQLTQFSHTPGDNSSLSDNFVGSVFEDRQESVWVATRNGLNKYDPKTRTFHQFFHNPEDPDSLSDNACYLVFQDSRDNLWIAVRNGLNKYNKKNGTFSRYQHSYDRDDTIPNNFIIRIHEDKGHNVWIGTANGICQYNPQQDNFQRYPFPDDFEPNRMISSIFEDSYGGLWIKTLSNRLCKIDRQEKRLIHLRPNPNDRYSLSEEFVFSIFEDRGGIVWFGTFGGGVCKYDPLKMKFEHFFKDINSTNTLAGNFIWSIFKDSAGHLWIGTHDAGLTRYNPTTNVYTNYKHQPGNQNSLTSNTVRCITEDHDRNIWIGTTRGLNKFDRKEGVFFRLPLTSSLNSSNPVLQLTVVSLLPDSRQNLWIGTKNRGLFKLNQATQQVSHFTSNGSSNSISNDSISALMEDRAGKIWICTSGGLNRYDPATGSFAHYFHRREQANSLSSNIVNSILEGAEGVFWIGTTNGLNQLDTRFNTIKVWSEKEGLPNNMVYGILKDERGNLWISTNKGISWYNIQTEEFLNFDQSDGLQSTEFNAGAYHQDKQDNLYFGGINGFNVFTPEKIRFNTSIPSLVFTDLRIFNKVVPIGRNKEGRTILKTSITTTEEIVLSYTDYTFSIGFSALNFSAPSKNMYSYKLVGYDKDWIQLNNRHFITFTNLNPGEYTLKVIGSNKDKIWNKEGASIRIVIRPLFYQTIWFKILALIILLVLFLFWYKRRLENIRIKTELHTAHIAQMSIMPQKDPQIENFEISGVCEPANEVGGDFFDYFWFDEEKTRFGIAIGDVSGKAMTAAITAVMTSGMLYSNTYESGSIKEIMKRINRPLYLKTEKKVFTSLFLASIDLIRKEFTFTNAGLNEPLLKRKRSLTHVIGQGPKFPLGILKQNAYLETTTGLEPDDVVVLFTDGLTDAQNAEEIFYSEERLVDFIKDLNTDAMSAPEIKQAILRDLKQFTGRVPRNDDITLIVIKVK